MDIGKIRQGLADALAVMDINVYAYPPGEPEDPAAVIGLPQQVTPNRTLGGDQVDILVTFYAARADDDDAVAKLDTALSTGIEGSILDVLRSATSTAWRGKPLVPLANAVREAVFVDASFLAADLTVTIFCSA